MADETVRVVIEGQDRLSGPAKQASNALGGLQKAAGQTTANLGGATRAAEQATRSFGGMSVSAKSGISGFVGLRGAIAPVIAMLAGGLAFKLAGDAIVGFNAQMEQSRIAWEVMLKSGDAAQTMLQGLQQFAAKTPFEFPEVEDASRKLLAMGFAARDVIPLMTDIGNVASGMGKGAEGMQRIVIALGQMQAKGKVTGEEMMQLTEMGVSTSQIFEIMAKQTGKSVAELQKMQEQGTLTADALIRAFRTYAQQNFGGMMEKQSRTFNGIMSTIRDNLRLVAASAFEPLFQKISELALKVGDFVQSEQFAKFGKDVQYVVSQVVNALSSIPGPVLQTVAAIGGIAAAVSAVAAVVSIAGPAIAAGFVAMTGPIGLVIAALSGLYLAYTNNLLGIKTWVDQNGGRILDGLIEGVGGIIDQLMPVLEQVAALFVSFFQTGEQLWNTYGENILSIFGTIFGQVIANAKAYLTVIIETFAAFMDVLSGNWGDAWLHVAKAANTVWTTLVDNAALVANGILSAFAWLIRQLASLFAGASAVGGWFGEQFGAADRWLQQAATSVDSFKQSIDLAVPEVKKLGRQLLNLHEDQAPFQDDMTESGRRATRAAAAIRGYADALRAWLTRPQKAPSWADINRGVLPSAAEKPPAVPLPKAGGGGGARDAAAAIKELVDALVRLHPATKAAADAVKFWDDSIKNVNLAIEANQDQLKAAQDELQRMQDHLRDLQDELTIAKQKLTEFSQPRLTGMGKFEQQIAAVQEQLKRIQLAKSLGVPLSQIIARFPRLTAGMEQYLSTLPQTEGGLSKVLDQLQLMQSLSFDEKMRLLAQAASDVPAEMDYGTAMAGTLQWKAEVDRLTLAITDQEAAIKRQEGVVKSLQQQGEMLNATLKTYQENLKQAQVNQDAVNAGLTLAYQWFVKDREEMLALGGTAAAMVPVIDAQMAQLLGGMDKFALGEAAMVQGGIVTLYETSKQKLDEILAKIAALNTTVVTTHVINTVYATNGQPVEGRAGGGPVYAGRAYTVGEVGRELFVPDTNGRIIPHNRTASYAGGSGLDYDRLAAAIARQPITLEMDGQTVALAVRDRLQRRGAGGMGR